jgi:hypothetical protein
LMPHHPEPGTRHVQPAVCDVSRRGIAQVLRPPALGCPRQRAARLAGTLDDPARAAEPPHHALR